MCRNIYVSKIVCVSCAVSLVPFFPVCLFAIFLFSSYFYFYV